MKISYEGMGQWAATFACGDVDVGEAVKVSENDTVAACSADDAFCGVVFAKARTGDACTVQLGGAVEVPYSGTAPTVGYAALAADGSGGVKVAAGAKERLVLAVDSAAGKAVIVL